METLFVTLFLLMDNRSHGLNNVALPPVVWLTPCCQFQGLAHPEAGGSTGGNYDIRAGLAKGCQVN